MTALPSPLLVPGRITTLLAPPDDELAALVAALAVSYRTGNAIVPGFVPEGPSELTLFAYRFTWIDWKLLAADICGVAGMATPVLHLRCPGNPLVTYLGAPSDPDAQAYWHPLVSADVDRDIARAKATGHELPPLLTIVFDPVGAAGPADGALQQLYSSLAGQTTLMAGLEAAEPWIEDFGPTIRLPSLHNSVSWRDVLAHITGGDSAESPPSAAGAVPVPRRRSRRAHRSRVDPDVPQMLEEVRAFFVTEGVEALLAFVRDGQSDDSQLLRDRARARGISSGRLWKAAEWLERHAAQSSNGAATLYGYGAVFEQWREVDSRLEGHYLERIRRGAFGKAIAEGRERMKVTFRHGKDPQLGFRSLGPLKVLQEDDCGVYYEVELANDDAVRSLVPALRAGVYGSSFTHEVLAEDLVKRPRPSRHNPDALPELTITEVRCSELGPVVRPAYAGTSAGIRSSIDVHSQ
jgi:HK97 family phage prohead protease